MVVGNFTSIFPEQIGCSEASDSVRRDAIQKAELEVSARARQSIGVNGDDGVVWPSQWCVNCANSYKNYCCDLIKEDMATQALSDACAESGNPSKKRKRRQARPFPDCPWLLSFSGSVPRTISIQAVSCTSPWFMTPMDGWSNNAQLVNYQGTERFVLQNCDFVECLFSRKGWMLISQPKVEFDLSQWKWKSFYLINPLKNKKIRLPDTMIADFGAFTITDDDDSVSPDCVVLVTDKCLSQPKLIVRTWRPGSRTWTENKRCTGGGLSSNVICGIVFSGNVVRLFDDSRCMLIFELSDNGGRWCLGRGLESTFQFSSHLLGQDGKETLKIDWSESETGRVYKFYKLGPLDLEWIELDPGRFMGKNWFINKKYALCSTDTAGGSRVYHTVFSSARPNKYRLANLVVDDLVTGCRHHRMPTFPALRSEDSAWVDLGM